LPPPSLSAAGAILTASPVHDGLREWLLCYASVLADLGTEPPPPPPPPPQGQQSGGASNGGGGWYGSSIDDAALPPPPPAIMDDVSLESPGSSVASRKTKQQYKKTPRDAATCPRGHGLTGFLTSNHTWWCSACRCV